LPLDGHVVEVLVADGLDDQLVAELPALDDRRRRWSRDNRVVLRAGDPLVEPPDDDRFASSSAAQ
jgi:hypothetical protein